MRASQVVRASRRPAGSATGCTWRWHTSRDATLPSSSPRTWPPTPPRAVRIVTQIARALHHAHECGLIHRDVTPARAASQGPTPSARRAHGEGGQQVGREDAEMPGGRGHRYFTLRTLSLPPGEHRRIGARAVSGGATGTGDSGQAGPSGRRRPTAGLVERPLPGNGHGGCGGGRGNHRWKHRQGAPGRPHGPTSTSTCTTRPPAGARPRTDRQQVSRTTPSSPPSGGISTV